MGYYMHQHYSKFFIPTKKRSEALEAMRAAAKDHRGWAWVHMEKILEATTIEEAIKACHWTYDSELREIHFEGEKYGDEDTIFAVIAPFVKKGSWITMSGEENAHWRWEFNGERVRANDAVIRYNTITQEEAEKRFLRIVAKIVTKRRGGAVIISRVTPNDTLYKATLSGRIGCYLGKTPLKAVRALWKALEK